MPASAAAAAVWGGSADRRLPAPRRPHPARVGRRGVSDSGDWPIFC